MPIFFFLLFSLLYIIFYNLPLQYLFSELKIYFLIILPSLQLRNLALKIASFLGKLVQV